MEYALNFIICFAVIYLLYLFIIVLRKKGLKQFEKSKQLDYFKIKHNLDFSKINLKKFANAVAITNAFIIAFTFTLIGLIDGIVLKVLVALVILVPLIYISYDIVGKFYKKKEGK